VAADLRVRLTPRARGPDGLTGVREGVVLARVSAPPVDGRANAALSRMVAKELGVAPTRVSVHRGHTARDKLLRIEGWSAADVEHLVRRLEG
jgi:uncharacterized protein